jgi:hypothetical protein
MDLDTDGFSPLTAEEHELFLTALENFGGDAVVELKVSELSLTLLRIVE